MLAVEGLHGTVEIRHSLTVPHMSNIQCILSDVEGKRCRAGVTISILSQLDELAMRAPECCLQCRRWVRLKIRMIHEKVCKEE